MFQKLFQGERAIHHCLIRWRRSTLLRQSHRGPRASVWQNQIWLFQVTFWMCLTVTVYFAQIDDELEQFFHKYALPLSCMTNSPMWVARALLLDCQASVERPSSLNCSCASQSDTCWHWDACWFFLKILLRQIVYNYYYVLGVKFCNKLNLSAVLVHV